MFGSDRLGFFVPGVIVAGRCSQVMMMMMMNRRWWRLLRVVTDSLARIITVMGLLLLVKLLHLQVMSLLLGCFVMVVVVMVMGVRVIGVVVERRVLGMDRLLQGCAILWNG